MAGTHKLKVLLQSRLDTPYNPAGDTIHLKELRNRLHKLGVSTSISYDLKPNVNKFDIIHIFNISRPYETYIQLKNAKESGKKVVLMPIFQNHDEWNKKGSIGISGTFFKLLPSQNSIQFIKNIGRCILDRSLLPTIPVQFTRSYLFLQKYIIENSNYVFLTTLSEKKDIELRLKIKIKKYNITPSGVDRGFSEAKPHMFIKKYKISNFILCVANFHSLKNHLSLIKAMQEVHLPLVLIGNRVKTYASYYDKIIKTTSKNPNIIIVTGIARELLQSAYAAAKVHVLPSWAENSPLVTLEAAVAGCNIVTTTRSYGNEFLKDNVWYCEPNDIQSIKKAILSAYNAKPNIVFKNYILNHFTWEKVAEKTLKYYKSILKE